MREISSDFMSVRVSGMSSDLLSRDRPYEDCSILYRKTLSSSVTPLDTCSSRVCGIRVCDFSGFVCICLSTLVMLHMLII